MKNKKIKDMLNHRHLFADSSFRCGRTGYIVEVPMIYARARMDNPKIYFVRWHKVYPNRKRCLLRAWKSLRWEYDEV